MQTYLRGRDLIGDLDFSKDEVESVLELAFVVAPENMKGFITACWLLTVALANWFINAPIADLYPSMHPGNYFLMLAAIGLVVAFLFIPVSRRFNRAMENARMKDNETE